MDLVRATVPIRTFLELEDLSEGQRDLLAKWFEWYVRDTLEDSNDADLVLDIARQWPWEQGPGN
jgi:hypothetical protein